MFAQAFNYHDTQIQLRFLGLMAVFLTLACLGVLEFRKARGRRTTTLLILLSALGTAAVIVIASLTSGGTS